jgi:3-hydroxybutyryl-CoA dehydrogenase
MASIESLAVIGAGTMGAGIAQVAAAAGIAVSLVDVDRSILEKALARIRANLDGAVARGKMDAAAAAATLGRISSSTSPAAADVLVEAVPENLVLKHKIFAAMEAVAPAHALLVTNTSSLSVAGIAAGVTARDRVVGMHFFNPVHLMKLVEIIRHDGTADEVVDTARALGERLGKDCIVVRDRPGFATSRLGVLVGLEAARMLEEGVASAADIDKGMRLGYGYPMGPLELGDLVGLDVRLAISEYLSRELGPRFTPPEILRKKVAAGHLGKKTGHGFYLWENGKIAGEG